MEKSPFETHGFQRKTNTDTKLPPLINGPAEGKPVAERISLGFGKTLEIISERKEEGLNDKSKSVISLITSQGQRRNSVYANMKCYNRKSLVWDTVNNAQIKELELYLLKSNIVNSNVIHIQLIQI